MTMIKVFDFKCPNGHKIEKFVQSGTTSIRCGCGEQAIKVMSATKCQLDGSSGDFPGQHMKWVREHEKAGNNRALQS